MTQAAEQSMAKAHYLAGKLTASDWRGTGL